MSDATMLVTALSSTITRTIAGEACDASCSAFRSTTILTAKSLALWSMTLASSRKSGNAKGLRTSRATTSTTMLAIFQDADEEPMSKVTAKQIDDRVMRVLASLHRSV